MRRLVVCCDGTWNDPADGTNVRKLWESVARSEAQPEPFYDASVGTGRDRILGGAFGQGLSKNIRDAYRWIAANYQTGDQLFLFGFSRGAFTVRSLVGFIRAAGLVPSTDIDRTNEAFKRYRNASGPDAPELQELRAHPGVRQIADIEIAVLGVWDTVGALGIPVVGPRSFIARRRWGFHDYALSSYVARAYQALAIDEKRTPFLAALWRVREPSNDAERRRREAQDVEQVFFAGCHSDVGGRAAAIAFDWLTGKAKAAGLEFDESKRAAYLPADNATQTVHESLSWTYKRYAGGVIRPLGDIDFLNQEVDASALRKLDNDGSYRPENLVRWADGSPMQSPRPLKFRFMVKWFQDYFLRQYARR